MQDLILILSMIVMFVLVGLFVRQLGGFLDSLCQNQLPHQQLQSQTLRIGFANPLVADNLSGILDHYARLHPEVSVFLFNGTTDELLGRLPDHKLDVIFLPEDTDIYANLPYHIREVCLSQSPAQDTACTSLSMQSFTEERLLQKVLWLKKGKAPWAAAFVKCLDGAFVEPRIQQWKEAQ